MWYVHTEYTLRNAIASHFLEDVTTYLQSQGIPGASTLKIPVSDHLTSQATCTCSGRFTTNTFPCAAHTWRRGEPSDETKQGLFECACETQLCVVPHTTGQEEHHCGTLTSQGRVQQPGSAHTNSCPLRLCPTAANSSTSRMSCWAGHQPLTNPLLPLLSRANPARYAVFTIICTAPGNTFPYTDVCNRQTTFYLAKNSYKLPRGAPCPKPASV